MAIALFSYVGVECVAVAAGKVRDPDRNVPRATLYGTLATATVYMLSLIAVFGILQSDQLANSTEPFSAAANAMFGGTWAGDVMAVLVIISGIGALNGWTMICAEMPLAAAYSRNTGHSVWVYWAPYLLAGAAMLAGIPVYRRARAQMTEPQPVPRYPANPG